MDVDTEDKRIDTFLRKTRRGKIRKIVREIYLRDDIWCGVFGCPVCDATHNTGVLTFSEDESLLLLDTNVVLHQIDFLMEDACIDNVVILSTVLNEVRHRNLQTYARLRSLCKADQQDRYRESVQKIKDRKRDRGHDADAMQVDTKDDSRRFYVFCNEFFSATNVSRKADETVNDRNDRAIRVAAHWYARHPASVQELLGHDASTASKRVLLLTNDARNKARAAAEGLATMTIYEYVDMLKHKFPNAGEKLAQLSREDAEDELRDEDELDEAGVAPSRLETPKEPSKGFFPPHMKESQIRDKIRLKELYQGVLRMNRTTCFEGYVACKGVEGDVRIHGRQDLNRAVDGDVVAVQLIAADDTGEDDKFLDDTQEDEAAEADRMEVEPAAGGQAAALGAERKTGRVVGVIKRGWREYCGSLRPLDDFRKVGSSAMVTTERYFIPADPRIPYIIIKTRHSHQLDNKRIVVAIDSWDRFSRYPRGHWVSILGDTGDKATESAVILKEHGVITRDFSEAVLKCLPPADFQITEEEIARRLDLRNILVCSIDPPGCKDIDDALSVEHLPNGNYRIGVHIADVTHYVKPDTAIDKEAAERCTTVYLVEKRTDMLPGLLTTDLCSLVGGRQRLAFSVLWEMTPKAEVKKTEFHKSVIKSSAALAYAEAQAIIDDPNDKSQLAINLRILLDLARQIRGRRMAKGALELASPEVKFELDSETADPTDVAMYQLRETNKLVEEFMLFANSTVATFILEKFPLYSVLRRHPPPKEDALKALKKLLASNGFTEFKYGSSKELAESLDRAVKGDDAYFNKLVRILTTRCMNQAVYFCTSEVDRQEFFHYGLAADLYTHFTSPIRRYADVLVHRLLAAGLNIEGLPDQLSHKDRISDQCDVINVKHRNAQWAGRASVDLHTYIYFKKKGPSTADSVVVRVRRNGVQVSIPRFGIEGVVLLKEADYTFDEDKQTLSHKSSATTISVFDHLLVSIRADDTDFRNRTVIEMVRKSSPSEILSYEAAEASRQQVEKEMFGNAQGMAEKPAV